MTRLAAIIGIARLPLASSGYFGREDGAWLTHRITRLTVLRARFLANVTSTASADISGRQSTLMNQITSGRSLMILYGTRNEKEETGK